MVGSLFGSKMGVCLDDLYTRAHALTVAAVFILWIVAMHSSLTEIMTQKFADIPERPHQPLNFPYPKRSFGKKSVVQRSFGPSWFSQWPFLHYEKSQDLVFCHTCVMGFKLRRMRTNSADPAFVSSVCNVRFSKLF